LGNKAESIDRPFRGQDPICLPDAESEPFFRGAEKYDAGERSYLWMAAGTENGSLLYTLSSKGASPAIHD